METNETVEETTLENTNETVFAIPDTVVLIEKADHLVEPKYTWRTKNYSIHGGQYFDSIEAAQEHAEWCFTGAPAE